MRHKIVYKLFKGGAQGVGTNGWNVAVMHILESSPLFQLSLLPPSLPFFMGISFSMSKLLEPLVLHSS